MARKKYKKTKRKEQLWIKSFSQTTVQLIHAHITRYHTYGDLEVVVTGMPIHMWKRTVKHWQSYVPCQKRKGYEEYKKTHSAQVFLDSFSGVQLTKKVTSGHIMKITIEQVSPVQAMYSSRYQKMVLTYWYEPFPFPLGWIPSY